MPPYPSLALPKFQDRLQHIPFLSFCQVRVQTSSLVSGFPFVGRKLASGHCLAFWELGASLASSVPVTRSCLPPPTHVYPSRSLSQRAVSRADLSLGVLITCWRELGLGGCFPALCSNCCHSRKCKAYSKRLSKNSRDDHWQRA